jgi:hypothetical protein
MKVCNADRATLYTLLAAAFAMLKIEPDVVELGVLRGDNAQRLQLALKPRRMLLVDAWSSQAVAGAMHPFEFRPDWIAPAEDLSGYFGGPVGDQATFDRLHAQCVERFAAQPGVQLLRADTVEALRSDAVAAFADGFHLAYIDANHRYEYVLRELLSWHTRVAADGVIQLNDCCHSAGGVRANFGVLPAVTEFVKRTAFVPVVLTNTDWSDLMLVRRGSRIAQALHLAVVHSNTAFVEIPPQLLGACRVVPGRQRPNLSFA